MSISVQISASIEHSEKFSHNGRSALSIFLALRYDPRRYVWSY
jgi:hypothetical protein